MSTRAIAVGKTGSGKTQWIYRRFLRRLPRVLYVDTIGEWRDKLTVGGRFDTGEQVTRYTTGVEETIDALEEVVDTNEHEWKIVADLEREEFEEVAIEAIAPRNIRRDSVLASHPPAAIFIDEISLMVPLGERYDHYAGLWLRGRHIGLSVFAATQRVSSVNKITTSQAEVIALLGLGEPNDLDYLTRRFGEEAVARAIAHTRSGQFRPAVWVDHDLTLYQPEPA